MFLWPCSPGTLCPCPLPSPQVPPTWKCPRCMWRWEAGCQHSCGAVPQGGDTKQGLQWAERLPWRGPREPLQDAPLPWLDLTALLSHRVMQCPESEDTAVPRPPQGHRDAACRANNSWRTNNLKGWSMGGKPSWEHPQQPPAGSAHRVSPQLAKAEAALPRQRCGGALVEEFSCPQCQTHGPPDPPGASSSPPPGQLWGEGSSGGGQGRL